ncbi:MAG TPA: N,N-dimethylformamidase beta subunit family domain-containing protein [Chryseolinea sp.]
MNQEKNTSKRILTLAGFLFFALLSAPVAAQHKSDVIVAENAKPGTTDWIITKVFRHPDEPYDKGWHRRKEIEGYVSHTSIRAGETLKVFVSTEPADKFTLDIFRMGYYGGKGGRLMKSFKSLKGAAQPTPADGKKNLIECQWTEGASFEIPKDWVSGVYLGKLSTVSTGAQAYIVFIVRDNRQADVLFQCSDMTWLAYNRWPQWRSFYDSPTSQWAARAPDNFDVGYDRPYGLFWNLFPAGFEPLTNGSGEFLMTEFPLAFWLEKEGYDVTYISNVDTHADGPGLLRGKAWLSVGHDEYWTQEMYDNVTKARDAGVSLAFLSGNAVSGRVKLLPNNNGVPNRVMTMVDRGFEEENLMGGVSYGVGLADWICAAPDHWAFEGTDMKKGDRVKQLVGWEFHGPPLPEKAKNLVVLAEGFVTKYDGTSTNRKYASTIYTAEKGNFVFNAATCWWNKVLSAPPAYMNPPYMFFAEGDERIRKITKNILNRMIATKKDEQGESEH